MSDRPTLRHRGNTLAEFQQDLLDNLYFQRGTTLQSASVHDAYQTLAVTVRDRLVDRRSRTAAAHYDARFVYYLSAEYLLGRQLEQNMLYTDTEKIAAASFSSLGVPYERLQALDVEPGLGNGGLGRLAACLMDSLATLDIPAVGYGIRYEFGIFKQAFDNGAQAELPDDWTFYGNPWEFEAPDDRQLVGFYGHTEPAADDSTGLRRPVAARLYPATEPMLVGVSTETVNMGCGERRAAAPSGSLDSKPASMRRPEDIVRSRTSAVSPTTVRRGRAIKQQYFLVSCCCVTSSGGSSSATATGRPSGRSSSSSTTPIRCSRSPNSRQHLDEHGVEWEKVHHRGLRLHLSHLAA
jgi:starch phosphorylase